MLMEQLTALDAANKEVGLAGSCGYVIITGLSTHLLGFERRYVIKRAVC